jgi:putative ABC transport system permease protein
MTSLRVLLSRLVNLLRRGRMETDLDRELRFHLQMETDRLLQTGMTPEDARSAALKRFGGLAQTKEIYRATGGLPSIETILQDVHHAARSLRKQPGFTAIAILTLAVGIGANTAIYTVLDATMLRSLPFREPNRLMRISLVTPSRSDVPINDDSVWSYPKYELFRKLQQSFEDTALYRPGTFNLTGADDPELLQGELVSASYFPLLGIRAEIGRTFFPSEDETPGKDFVAVISHSLWVDRFGADPAIAGKTIVLNQRNVQRNYMVVGVMPAGFRALGGPADVWVPVHTDAARQLNEANLHSFEQVARLKPGVSIARAKAEVASLGPRIDDAFPGPAFAKGYGAKARTLDEARVDPLIRTSVLVLFGAVTLVLLIACANLANLLLARGSTRRREIAIRFAVGATKSRIVRYLLTESLLLAGLGAGASLALAYAGVFALNLINPVNGSTVTFGRRLSGLTILGLGSIHLDSRALFFTLAVALVTGVLFGLAPAFAGARTDVNDALKNGSARTSGIASFASKSLLVIAEVSLTMVLLAGAGLTLKSFERLIATRSGVDPENVLTVRVAFQGTRSQQFFDQLDRRVAALPGVLSAGLSDCPVLAGGCSSTSVGFPDRPPVPEDAAPLNIGVHWASPDYFKTMKIPLIRGRWFAASDRADSPKVVIIGETAARRYWPGEDPIGKPIALGCCGFGDKDGAVVIGIVGDVRFGQLDEPPQPDAYVSSLQSLNGMMLFVRAASNPLALTDAVRAEIHALDKDRPVYDVKSMRQRIADSTARARFIAILLPTFAAIAFALAGIGIYGVMSYMVRQRIREIGIRMALGARSQDVRSMVVLRAARLAAAGIVIGLAGALGAARVLGTLLYDVKPSDPRTYLLISALLVVLAALASYLPARRASKVDPCVTLRSE